MPFRFFGRGGRTWWLLFRIKTAYLNLVYQRRFKCGGGNFPDVHFYVIGVDFHDEGLFSIVKCVLSHIEYAVSKGMTPIVNMRDFPSMYYKKDKNVWEDFFEQPCGYHLDDIYEAKHVTFSPNIGYLQGYEIWSITKQTTLRFQTLKKLYAQYIRPTLQMKNLLQEGVKNTINNKTQVMACICRGTDYTNTLVGIRKQPTSAMLIQKAKEMMLKNNLKYIYCATEDARIYRDFEKAFGEILLPNIQRKYEGNDGRLLAQVNKDKNIDANKIAQEYFQSIFIISQCDAFVGGNVSGTDAALLMPNKFKSIYVFQLGSTTLEDINAFS